MEGVDAAGDVDDFRVCEAADDVEDGVSLADVREELVAEAFALGGAFDDAGDVHELHGGGDDGVGLDHGDDAIHAGVRDLDDADVGIDGAEGVVGGLSFCGGECVEDGALAYVGQAYDSDVKGHSE